jgi:hypothetical protein
MSQSHQWDVCCVVHPHIVLWHPDIPWSGPSFVITACSCLQLTTAGHLVNLLIESHLLPERHASYQRKLHASQFDCELWAFLIRIQVHQAPLVWRSLAKQG